MIQENRNPGALAGASGAVEPLVAKPLRQVDAKSCGLALEDSAKEAAITSDKRRDSCRFALTYRGALDRIGRQLDVTHTAVYRMYLLAITKNSIQLINLWCPPWEARK